MEGCSVIGGPFTRKTLDDHNEKKKNTHTHSEAGGTGLGSRSEAMGVKRTIGRGKSKKKKNEIRSTAFETLSNPQQTSTGTHRMPSSFGGWLGLG